MPKKRAPSKEAFSKELLYKVLAILYRYASEIAVLEHPRSIERRSVDLAVRLRDGRGALIKVAYDLDDLPRSELSELRALAATLGLPALVVASAKSGSPLLEGVVYERYGIPSVSPETLDNVLSGREPVYIRVEKESFTVSIDGETLRRRRMEKNMSLGDLALALGVSRRTVYEYEKGSMEPSIEKAEKLIRMFGEDIARPIDIFTPAEPARSRRREAYDTSTEESVARALEEQGYLVAHVKRTVVDIVARRGAKDDISLVVEHPGKRGHGLVEKAYYMTRLAETIGIKEAYIVVETRSAEKDLEKEGYKTVRPRDLLDLIREARGEASEGSGK